MTATAYKRSVELLEAPANLGHYPETCPSTGDELIARNAEAGECFGFNEVATSVWRSLTRPKTFEELRDELVSVYDVGPDQCAAELGELLAEMISKGLVEETSLQSRGHPA